MSDELEDPGMTIRVADALKRDDENLLVGFVVVAEYATLDGGRYLRKRTSDASGRDLLSWVEQGYLHAALHTDWGDEDDD